MRVFNVLNLVAGWQSSRILLGSELGELPLFDAAVFGDTMDEPKLVYDHLAWMESFCTRNKIVRVSAGDIRQTEMDFRRGIIKRSASAPMFVKNNDKTQGRIPRRCTKEYKIEPIEKWIRQVLLGLLPRQRVPQDVIVRQWYGISDDEGTRASFPGRMQKRKINVGSDLNGDAIEHEVHVWNPSLWRQSVYCLLNEMWTPDRKIVPETYFPRRQSRVDCGAWLADKFPGREIPRSACKICPNRTNAEWKALPPSEFSEVIEFDAALRSGKKMQVREMAGEVYLHRQMVPLNMVDFSGDGERTGGGCGTLFDGEGGYCDS